MEPCWWLYVVVTDIYMYWMVFDSLNCFIYLISWLNSREHLTLRQRSTWFHIVFIQNLNSIVKPSVILTGVGCTDSTILKSCGPKYLSKVSRFLSSFFVFSFFKPICNVLTINSTFRCFLKCTTLYIYIFDFAFCSECMSCYKIRLIQKHLKL